MRSRSEGEVLDTVAASVVQAVGGLAVHIQGQIYEASNPQGFVLAIGDTVLLDYLPGSSQWVVVQQI